MSFALLSNKEYMCSMTFYYKGESMKVESLFKIINSEFYTGVPDSQLKALCSDCSWLSSCNWQDPSCIYAE